MAIGFSCKCGKKIKAKEELAGRKVKCPQCGMPVEVPIPTEVISEDGLELLPLEKEIPEYSQDEPSPSQEERNEPSGNIPVTRRCPNPKCRAEIMKDDVICHACGTQVGYIKGRVQRKFSFFEQPLVRFAIAIIALAIIGIVVYTQFFREKPDDGKPKTLSPDDALIAEIKNTESPNLKSLAKALAGTPANALKILFEEYQAGDLAKKTKAAKGMVLLAFYGAFNSTPVYLNITEKCYVQHIEIKALLIDLFYLISIEQPEGELVENYKEIKQCSSYFKAGGKKQILSEARRELSKFAYDDEPFLSIKSSAALVSLGEYTRLDKVATFLESTDTRLRDKARMIISYFTGKAFETKESWDTWWATNKTLTPKEWKQ